MTNLKGNIRTIAVFLFIVAAVGYFYSCSEVKDNGIATTNTTQTDANGWGCCDKYEGNCGIIHLCMTFTGAVPPYGAPGHMRVTGSDCEGEPFECDYDFVFQTNSYAMGNYVPNGGHYTFYATCMYNGIYYYGGITVDPPSGYGSIFLSSQNE